MKWNDTGGGRQNIQKEIIIFFMNDTGIHIAAIGNIAAQRTNGELSGVHCLILFTKTCNEGFQLIPYPPYPIRLAKDGK